LLAGMSIRSGAEAESAIAKMHRQGARAVLLKGGHLDEGDAVIDRFSDGASLLAFHHARLPLKAHGTGCTLAAAIAARRCLGDELRDACRHAGDYVFGALRAGYRPGRSDVTVLEQVGPPGGMHSRKKAGD
jgi:hydroxymethylpyrimidine/phosphomethylpyrimidine kinase